MRVQTAFALLVGVFSAATAAVPCTLAGCNGDLSCFAACADAVSVVQIVRVSGDQKSVVADVLCNINGRIGPANPSVPSSPSASIPAGVSQSVPFPAPSNPADGTAPPPSTASVQSVDGVQPPIQTTAGGQPPAVPGSENGQQPPPNGQQPPPNGQPQPPATSSQNTAPTSPVTSQPLPPAPASSTISTTEAPPTPSPAFVNTQAPRAILDGPANCQDGTWNPCSCANDPFPACPTGQTWFEDIQSCGTCPIGMSPSFYVGGTYSCAEVRDVMQQYYNTTFSCINLEGFESDLAKIKTCPYCWPTETTMVALTSAGGPVNISLVGDCPSGAPKLDTSQPMLLFESTSNPGAIVPADPCTPFIPATSENLGKALAMMKGNQTIIKNISGGSCGSVKQVLESNASTSGSNDRVYGRGWWAVVGGIAAAMALSVRAL